MPQGKRGSEIDALAVEYSNQVLDQEADKQGVPRDFARKIAGIESADRPDVITGGRRSSAGAIGKMQLMPATAKGLGVDPYNIDQNIAGGVKYLGQQLKSFGGDQRLAAAAYNSGPGNVRKYKGVPPFPETQKYAANFGGGEESEIDKLAREFSGKTSTPKPARPTTQPLGRPDTNPFSISAPTGFQSAVQGAGQAIGQIGQSADYQSRAAAQANAPTGVRNIAGRVGRGLTSLANAPAGLVKTLDVLTTPPDWAYPAGAKRPVAGAPGPFESAARPVTDPLARAQKAAAGAIPVNEMDNSFLTAKLPEAVGSGIGFMAGGGAGRMLGMGARAVPALLGAGTNVEQVSQEFDAAGGDPEKRNRALLAAAATGSLEAFGVGGQAGKAGKAVAQGLKQAAKKVGKEGVEEGAQEYGSEYGGDINARLIGQYDKSRSLSPVSRNKLEAAALGGIVGGGFQAARSGIESVSGRRVPTPPVIDRAQPSTIQRARPLSRMTTEPPPAPTAPLGQVLPGPRPNRRMATPGQRPAQTEDLTQPLTQQLTEPLTPNAPETAAMPAVPDAANTAQMPQETAPAVNPRNRTIIATKQNADRAQQSYQEAFESGDYEGAERSLREQKRYLSDLKSIIGKPKTPGDSVQRARIDAEIGSVGNRLGEVRKARRGLVPQEKAPADLQEMAPDAQPTAEAPRITVPETARVTAVQDAPTADIVPPEMLARTQREFPPVRETQRAEEVKPAPSGRRVRINDQDVDLSPEQATRWDESAAKYQQDRASIQRSLDQGIIDKQQAGERMRGLGMRESAERREIAQAFTPKERAAQAKKEASNYRGKEVEIEGRKGKVAGMSFGKVRVKLEDGSIISVDQDKIGAPKPVELTEAPPEPPQIERPASLARIADQPSVLRESRPTQKANAPETARLRPPTRVPEANTRNIEALERRYENVTRTINERPDSVSQDLRDYRRELGGVIGDYRRGKMSDDSRALRNLPRPSPAQLVKQGERDAEAGRVAREYFRNAKASETGALVETPENAPKTPQVQRAQESEGVGRPASTTGMAKTTPSESQAVVNKPVRNVDDLAVMRNRVARMSASEVDRALTDAEAARNEDIANPQMGGRTRSLGNQYRKALNERRSSLVSKKELPAKRPMSSEESLGMKWNRDPEFRQEANAFNEEFGRYPADVAELRRGRPKTEPIATIQHERFGEVEVTGKAPGGKLIVEDADGQSHTIKNPRTTGNRGAAFVKKPLTEELGIPVAQQMGKLSESAVRPSKPASAKLAAKESVKEAAKGLDNVAKGLGKLFSPKKFIKDEGGSADVDLGASKIFDDATYAEAKPYFAEAYEHFKGSAKNAVDATRLLINELKTRYGFDNETVDQMRPYIDRYASDRDPEARGKEMEGLRKTIDRMTDENEALDEYSYDLNNFVENDGSFPKAALKDPVFREAWETGQSEARKFIEEFTEREIVSKEKQLARDRIELKELEALDKEYQREDTKVEKEYEREQTRLEKERELGKEPDEDALDRIEERWGEIGRKIGDNEERLGELDEAISEAVDQVKSMRADVKRYSRMVDKNLNTIDLEFSDSADLLDAVGEKIAEVRKQAIANVDQRMTDLQKELEKNNKRYEELEELDMSDDDDDDADTTPQFVKDAEARLRDTATGKQANAGQALLDQAIVAGYRIYRSGMDFAQWARAVMKDVGNEVRPQLRAAWDALTTDTQGAVEESRNRQAEYLSGLEEREATKGERVRELAAERGRLQKTRDQLSRESALYREAGRPMPDTFKQNVRQNEADLRKVRKNEARTQALFDDAGTEQSAILSEQDDAPKRPKTVEDIRSYSEKAQAKGERVRQLEGQIKGLLVERRAIQADQTKLEAAGEPIPKNLTTSLEKNTADLRQVRKDLARNRVLAKIPASLANESQLGNDKGYYLDKAEGTDKAPVLYVQDDLWGRAPFLQSAAGGLAFSEKALNAMAESLAPKNRYSQITPDEQSQLLSQIRKARDIASAKGLSGLAFARKSTFADPEQKVAVHESFHIGQYEALKASGDESQNLYALHDKKWAKDNPVLRKVIKTPYGQRISLNFNDKLDINMLAVELPAIISEGGGGLSKFGGQLSEGDAIEYMYSYLDHIYDYRGKSAFEEIAKRARLDARTEGYFKTIREERADAAGLAELGGNRPGIRETEGPGAQQGADSRAPDAVNGRKNETREEVGPVPAPFQPPAQKPSLPAGLARQRAIAQAKQTGKPPVAATPKVAPQAKPATPGQAPKTPAVKAPQTAQEYFDEQVKKSPFNVAGQRVKDLANEEARTALKKAADRVVRGKMNPTQEKAVISAADDLMMAGRLGDQDGIKKGRDSLLRAMRNTDQQGAVTKGALTVARAPKQALRAAQSIVYGGDISFPLRQAAPMTLNPFNAFRTWKAVKSAYNAFGREEAGNMSVLPGSQGAEAVRKQLESHKRYDLANQAGVELSVAGNQEEVYRDAGWAEKVPLLKTWMRRTQAANESFLDVMRLESFDKYATAIEKNTKLSAKQKELAMKSAADVINTMSGRTDLGEGKVKEAADALNGIFAAPRLLASRAKLLDPTAIAREWKKNPDVAKQMMKDAVGVVGPAMGLLTLAAAAGAKVGWNPEDEDFGKVVVGDTAIDFTAGLTPLMKLAYKWTGVASAVAKEASDPTEENTKERQRAQRDAIYRTGRFTRSKLGPAPSYLADLLWFGEDFEKNKTTLRSTINPMDPNFAPYRLAAPLGVTGAVKDIREEGSSAGKVAATSALEFFGASAYNKKARGEKLDRKSKFIQESETQGIDFRDLRPEKGEPDQIFKARTGKANSWLTQYGEQLVNSPDYRAATPEQKERALRSLKARVMTEAKQRAPNMGNFNPSSIIRSIRQSERTRRRNRSDLIWAPPED